VTVVFFSDIAWDSLHQRPQHLATLLGVTHRVLWVEPATLGRPVVWTPRGQVSGVVRMTLPAFPLNARLHWIRSTAVFLSRARVLREIVTIVQRMLLRRGVRCVRAPGEEIVCIVENFLFMHLAGSLRARRVVFDYIDDVFGFAAFPAFVRSEWLSALRRADVVTVTSPTLRRRITEAHDRAVTIVPNGVEYDRFARAGDDAPPADLPAGGPPVIGYVGSIYPWVDFGLLERTLDAMTDLRFVMIGQVHPDVTGAMSRLAQHPNFTYLGLKPYAEVPGYLRRFHAGIIPFRRTLLTEGVNPVKLYEYSAAGVPTVATDFSDDTRAFADIVLIARTAEEFAEQIRVAVGRRADAAFTAKLAAFARANDWKRRSEVFLDILQQHGT